MCQKEINPKIVKEDIREMIIQHILTEDLFKSVFDEADFHHENNIAGQLERLVDTFMSRTMRQNQLGDLNYYYKTLNTQAALVGDHHEKQKFLKVVYENFYKVYNPKGADKLGVVYTPNEIVRFMVEGTDFLLQKYFNKQLSDKNVHILDPATGTGTFITDIIDFIPEQYLEHKYLNEIFANEVAILPYYIANLNIEYTFKQKMRKYIEFPNSCFVDTLENIFGFEKSMGKRLENYKSTGSLFGLSSENTARIQRQIDQTISVIIGNPPYNANQQNFNDFNQNRIYKFIDKRVKDTYVKKSDAQKTKVYDMYAKFYRWATDRLEQNGVVAFITNRSFIDSKTFDGFRKSVEKEFDSIYIIDLKGDIRGGDKKNAAKSNVFNIQTGVAIMFLVKKIKEKSSENKNARIHYHEVSDELIKEDKLKYLQDNKLEKIAFDTITPTKTNKWLNISDNSEWQHFIPLVSKNAKLGRGNETLFTLFSLGTSTNRDEWVYDSSKKNLEAKAKFLSNEYNSFIKNGAMETTIKLSRDLENKFKRKLKSKFDKKYISKINYRPFRKKWYYAEKLFSDVLTQNHYTCFGKKLETENKIITLINHSQLKNFDVFCTKNMLDAGFSGRATPYIPLYRYDEAGIIYDNMTDWGLNQFIENYKDKTITKEAIFNYTYAVLHNPEYKAKYELNLKDDFPRLPFYKNFHQWVNWGKQLLKLHIDYETVEPYNLRVLDNSKIYDKKYKLKVKLKASPTLGTIEIDEQTYLLDIPDEAWQYKLANRTAIDWVLDQYKEKKIADRIVAEQFDDYRFTDYKNEVIDLLKKVCTVSVETMKIIEEMENH